MTNIFLNFKNMNHQLSNALSAMFLRRLVIFLYFRTCVFDNSQKNAFSGGSGPQLDFLPHIYMRQEAKFDPGFPRKGVFFEDLRAHMSQSVET